MITINLFSRKESKTLTVDGNGSPQFVSDLLSLLPYNINSKGKYEVETLQTATETLLEGLATLAEKYKTLRVGVYKMRDFIKDVGVGNEFLIFPGEITDEQARQIGLYMMAKSESDSQKTVKDITDIRTRIEENYTIYHQSGEKDVHIGESDRTKRVCRYCQRSMLEVTFRQKAHTISESLGNKTIVTNTECDVCNNKYGSIIERDFANYHQFFRLFYNLKDKDDVGVSNSNYTLTHTSEKSMTIGITLTDEQIKEMEEREARGDKEVVLPLDSGLTIVPVNVYKALCKYSLGILPDDICTQYKSTVEWFDEKRIFPILPKVAYLFPTGFRLPNPRITTLVRKTDSPKLPFTIGVVEFSDVAYAFIIPVDGDSCDYVNSSLWDEIKQALPLYKPEIGWTLKDLSSEKPIHAKTTVKFKMDLSKEDKGTVKS